MFVMRLFLACNIVTSQLSYIKPAFVLDRKTKSLKVLVVNMFNYIYTNKHTESKSKFLVWIMVYI